MSVTNKTFNYIGIAGHIIRKDTIAFLEIKDSGPRISVIFYLTDPHQQITFNTNIDDFKQMMEILADLKLETISTRLININNLSMIKKISSDQTEFSFKGGWSYNIYKDPYIYDKLEAHLLT